MGEVGRTVEVAKSLSESQETSKHDKSRSMINQKNMNLKKQ